MPVYLRRAHKAEKLVKDLGVARNRVEIATNVVAVTILDKGTGSFKLTWVFYDGTEFTLDQDEVLNGDVFEWDIARLLLTNAAQAGLTLKLIVDVQLGPSPPST